MASLIPQAGTANNTLITTLDAHTPLYAQKLYQPYGGQDIEILTFLKSIGAMREVTGTTGWHWEEDQFDNFFTSNGIVTGLAGANIVITLPAGEVDSTFGQSYPIVGELYIHEPSQKKYQVVAKATDGTTVTLRPLLAADTSSVAANDKFIPYSISVKEGSDALQGQMSFWTKYFWYTQIERNDEKITGTELTNSTQPVMSEDGKSILGYWSRLRVQQEYRLLKRYVGALMWGVKDDNLAATTSFQTTPGMIDIINSRGQTETTGGAATVADIQNLGYKFDSVYSYGSYLGLLSARTFSQISADAIADFNQSNLNAVNNELSNALFGQSAYGTVEQLSATYDFKGLILDGRNYALKRFTFLDDPKGAAANTTSKLRDYAPFIPIGKARVKDATGTEVLKNHVEMLYKSHAGYNRAMKVWMTGANAATPTSAVDELNCHMLCDFGFDFVNFKNVGMLKY